MAFVNAAPLTLRKRPAVAPLCQRVPKMAIDQTAVVTLATMAVGIGGGIGLVAWTENQGKRTALRTNVQVCTECLGEGVVTCNVCNGTGVDTLDDTLPCSYCEGTGTITCTNCGGSGIQPRFLDRLSPEDFMD